MSETAANDSVPVAALEECLECPVCLELPQRPPVFQCERGHILCSRCHARLNICPSCQMPLGLMRCLVAEKILEKVPMACKFAKNGCRQRMAAPSQPDHASSCAFRDIVCIEEACQEKLPMSQMLAHLKSSHADTIQMWPSAKVDMMYYLSAEELQSDWFNQPVHFEVNGRGYIMRLELHHSSAVLKNNVQCWIYGFQFKEDLKRSRCRIKFIGSESVTYEGPIVSAEVHPSEVEQTGLGFIISLHLLKRILDGNNLSVVAEILEP